MSPTPMALARFPPSRDVTHAPVKLGSRRSEDATVPSSVRIRGTAMPTWGSSSRRRNSAAAPGKQPNIRIEDQDVGPSVYRRHRSIDCRGIADVAAHFDDPRPAWMLPREGDALVA